MKRLFIISLVLLVLVPVSNAQRWRLQRFAVNYGVGSTNYFGDIGGAATENNLYGLKDIDIMTSRPFMNLGASYKILEKLDLKVNFTYGYLAGKDEGSQYAGRELSFFTSMFEPSVMASWSFISFGQKKKGSGRLFSRRGMMNNFSRMDIYAFGGVGYLMYKPTISSEDAYNYRVLKNGTVEFSEASASSLVIPGGIGIEYVLNKEWNLGVEIGGRYTMTDHLDGFASIYSNFNDLYYVTMFKATYKIRTSRNGMPVIEFLRKY